MTVMTRAPVLRATATAAAAVAAHQFRARSPLHMGPPECAPGAARQLRIQKRQRLPQRTLAGQNAGRWA